MSRQLPLFPLDVVLFPAARLPLHIFEPRYQALLIDVMAADGRFGLLPPDDDGAEPVTGTIGCIARIVAQQPLPDGRSNIVVLGESRFVLRRLLDASRSYHVGLVDEFGDEEGSAELPGDMAEALRHLAGRCRTALAILTDQPPLEAWAEDPATLTFQVASALPWPADQARQILTLRSAAQRADVLLQLLPRIVPDLEGRATVHQSARTNGKGVHAPELGAET